MTSVQALVRDCMFHFQVSTTPKKMKLPHVVRSLNASLVYTKKFSGEIRLGKSISREPKRTNKGYLIFRGMALTPQELEQVLRKGLDPREVKKTLSGNIWFSYRQTEAAEYAIKRYQALLRDGVGRLLVVLELKEQAHREFYRNNRWPEDSASAKFTNRYIPPQSIGRVYGVKITEGMAEFQEIPIFSNPEED